MSPVRGDHLGVHLARGSSQPPDNPGRLLRLLRGAVRCEVAIHRLHPQEVLLFLVFQFGYKLVGVTRDDSVESDTLLRQVCLFVDLAVVSMLWRQTEENFHGKRILRSVAYLFQPVFHELEVVVPERTGIDGCGWGDSDACDVDDSSAICKEARLSASLDDIVHGKHVAYRISVYDLLPLADVVGEEVIVVLDEVPRLHVAGQEVATVADVVDCRGNDVSRAEQKFSLLESWGLVGS